MGTQTFTDEMSSTRKALLIGTWVVCTLIGFTTLPWLGFGFLVLGGAIFLLQRWLAKSQVITCDDEGLTVAATSRRAGTTTTTVEWSRVTETRYSEETVGDDEEAVTTRHFAVFAGNATVLKVSEASKQFKPIIAAICDRTTHLGYQWVPRKSAPKEQILERGGEYVKVRR